MFLEFSNYIPGVKRIIKKDPTKRKLIFLLTGKKALIYKVVLIEVQQIVLTPIYLILYNIERILKAQIKPLLVVQSVVSGEVYTNSAFHEIKKLWRLFVVYH